VISHTLGRLRCQQGDNKSHLNRPKRCGLQLDQKVAILRPVSQRHRDASNPLTGAPDPTVDELRPNMSNARDQPWHLAKRQIDQAQGELTQTWQVAVDKRTAANAPGILRWPDHACTLQPSVSAAPNKAPSSIASLRSIFRQTARMLVRCTFMLRRLNGGCLATSSSSWTLRPSAT
jgi:hypothetical protein